ncbi:hypothetical protein PULV_a0239 [Pseudoalteromonas ulvae UL12]|uniref:hypothetical protein n=1 Tax=Pseudoalteromonas ulvae TaxID=107327 RepID=UPI00186B652A|nr:hypothetical protein [Pseudoalteromonas ulvae]MBE0362697.1 hypothetical protein [Pseudoalteromonas ulvae UL12]
MSAFWNFRVIKCEGQGDEETLFQIHEVEYNINGRAVNWSETSVAPFGRTLEELKEDTQRQQSAFEKPVLKVVRKARGYELVDIETGEDAYAQPPAGLTES